MNALIRLPTYNTAFIGRDDTAQAVATLLQQADVRLVTLVGMSGSGKTRLSLQVAEAMASQFPDGRVFVDLAPLTDASLVLPTIAHTLGIGERGSVTLLDTLIDTIGDQALLLIVDNVEQVQAAAADIHALISNSTRLHIIVTSQLALGVPSEHIFEVPPLTVPSAVNQVPEKLRSSPAVALFIDRMRQVQPEFTLTAQNMAAVLEICQLVEGLPLAIELIAAHSAVLAPGDLVVLLRGHLKVGQVQHTDSRERVIRPVLDWCYGRLPAPYQQLFTGLGVFAGGSTLATISAVCSVDADLDLAQALQTLVEKNLVQYQTSGVQTPRYTMIDAVQDYARQRLERTRQLSQLTSALASSMVDFARSLEPVIDGPEQVRWLNQLEDEVHNIRTALRLLIAKDQGNAALLLASMAGYLWEVRGYWREARMWLEQIFALKSTTNIDQILANRYRLGLILSYSGSFAAATEVLEQGRQLAEQVGNQRAGAKIISGLATLAYQQGQLEQAVSYYMLNLELFSALGDQMRTAATWANLAACYLDLGHYDAATQAFETSIAMLRPLQTPLHLALTLNNQGALFLMLAQFERASSPLNEAEALLKGLEDQHGQAQNAYTRSIVAFWQGELAWARQLIERALMLAHSLNLTLTLVEWLVGGAMIAQAQQDAAQAQAWLCEATLLLQQGSFSLWEHGIVTEQWAAFAANKQQWQTAVMLLAAADQQFAHAEEQTSPIYAKKRARIEALIDPHVASADRKRWSNAGKQLSSAAVAQLLIDHGWLSAAD